jgi:catechol 2,3-dioxygenase-like lactoylglutathione lyase family enzyme
MINGAHVIIYSANPDADRAFLRDVLKLTHVDVGHGWLIFGLPPSEIAVHPAEANGSTSTAASTRPDRHELYFMCDDIQAFVAAMTTHGISCGAVQNQGWGMLSQLTLPGGGTLGVYQPRHARPAPMG